MSEHDGPSRSEITQSLAALPEAVGFVKKKFLTSALLGITLLLSRPEQSTADTSRNHFLADHGTRWADEMGITGEGTAVVVFDDGLQANPSFTPLFEACVAVSGDPGCSDGPGIHFGPGTAASDQEGDYHGDRVAHTVSVTAPGARIVPVKIADGDGVVSIENLAAAVPAIGAYMKQNYPSLSYMMVYSAGFPVPNSYDCNTYNRDLTDAINRTDTDETQFFAPAVLSGISEDQKMYPACMSGALAVSGVVGPEHSLVRNDAVEAGKPVLSAMKTVDIQTATREFDGYGDSYATAIVAGMSARVTQAQKKSGNHEDTFALLTNHGGPVRDQEGHVLDGFYFVHGQTVRYALGFTHFIQLPVALTRGREGVDH